MDTSSSTPRLCANGCGFFGNPATNNLCSKCYKDHLKEEASKNHPQQTHRKQPTSPDLASPIIPSLKDLAIGKISDEINTSEAPEIKKGSTNRCVTCKKKVPLPGFKCRCGELFCGEHRYPEVHACDKLTEYKEKGRAVLAKQNPLIMADKIGNKV